MRVRVTVTARPCGERRLISDLGEVRMRSPQTLLAKASVGTCTDVCGHDIESGFLVRPTVLPHAHPSIAASRRASAHGRVARRVGRGPLALPFVP